MEVTAAPVFPYFNLSDLDLGNLTLPTGRGNLAWHRQATRWLDMYFVPFAIFIGLIGNTLSFLVFVCTPMKRLSASVYLAALALSDNGFLICALLSWSTNFGVSLYHRTGWCQAFVYFSYICGFLSVWYVVGFTVERYIAVCFPLRRGTMCTARRAKMVVAGLAIVAALLYCWTTWTSTVLHHPAYGVSLCVPDIRYEKLVSMMINLDTFITLLIPCLMLIVLNVRIVCAVSAKNILNLKPAFLWSDNQRRAVRSDSDATCPLSPDDTSTPPEVARPRSKSFSHVPRVRASLPLLPLPLPAQSVSALSKHFKPKKHIRIRNNAKVTRMLLVVSSIFLILNIPAHSLRIYGFFASMFDSSFASSLTPAYFSLQEFFTYVFYMNFSVNFILYSLCGSNFRSSLKFLFRRCCRRHESFDFETDHRRFSVLTVANGLGSTVL